MVPSFLLNILQKHLKSSNQALDDVLLNTNSTKNTKSYLNSLKKGNIIEGTIVSKSGNTFELQTNQGVTIKAKGDIPVNIGQKIQLKVQKLKQPIEVKIISNFSNTKNSSLHLFAKANENFLKTSSFILQGNKKTILNDQQQTYFNKILKDTPVIKLFEFSNSTSPDQVKKAALFNLEAIAKHITDNISSTKKSTTININNKPYNDIDRETKNHINRTEKNISYKINNSDNSDQIKNSTNNKNKISNFLFKKDSTYEINTKENNTQQNTTHTHKKRLHTNTIHNKKNHIHEEIAYTIKKAKTTTKPKTNDPNIAKDTKKDNNIVQTSDITQQKIPSQKKLIINSKEHNTISEEAEEFFNEGQEKNTKTIKSNLNHNNEKIIQNIQGKKDKFLEKSSDLIKNSKLKIAKKVNDFNQREEVNSLEKENLSATEKDAYKLSQLSTKDNRAINLKNKQQEITTHQNITKNSKESITLEATKQDHTLQKENEEAISFLKGFSKQLELSQQIQMHFHEKGTDFLMLPFFFSGFEGIGQWIFWKEKPNKIEGLGDEIHHLIFDLTLKNLGKLNIHLLKKEKDIIIQIYSPKEHSSFIRSNVKTLCEKLKGLNFKIKNIEVFDADEATDQAFSSMLKESTSSSQFHIVT